MDDIIKYIEDSLRYTFDQVLGNVKEEHRQDVEGHLVSILAPHISRTPVWMVKYLKTIDTHIKKREEMTWTHYLLIELTQNLSTRPYYLPHGYVIFTGSVMTEAEMHENINRYNERKKKIKVILDDEKDNIVRFVEQQDKPVYVTTIVDKFGKDLDEREVYRSAVWGMISDKDLLLNNDLSVSVGGADV